MKCVMTPQVVPESWSAPIYVIEHMVAEVESRGGGWVAAPCSRWPRERRSS